MGLHDFVHDVVKQQTERIVERIKIKVVCIDGILVLNQLLANMVYTLNYFVESVEINKIILKLPHEQD